MGEIIDLTNKDKDKKDTKESKSPVTYSYASKPCDHSAPLQLGTGVLYGVGGHWHEQNFGDLNVWLCTSYAPRIPFYANFTSECDLEQPSHVIIPCNDREALNEAVIDHLPIIKSHLDAGCEVIVSCVGGHGRTGTLLALVVAHMLPDVEDPIKYVREHIKCSKLVETKDQAEQVFKFMGQELPQIYVDEFKTTWGTGYGGYVHQGMIRRFFRNETERISEIQVIDPLDGETLWWETVDWKSGETDFIQDDDKVKAMCDKHGVPVKDAKYAKADDSKSRIANSVPWDVDSYNYWN